MGETGSGKTTIAKLLTRLMDPAAGAVRLGGIDLREVPFADLRRHVLLVPQEGFLFDATLRDTLAFEETRSVPRAAGLDDDDERRVQAAVLSR